MKNLCERVCIVFVHEIAFCQQSVLESIPPVAEYKTNITLSSGLYENMK